MRLDTPTAKLFFNTVRINTTSPDDTARMGTGFFYERIINGQLHQFLLTSKRTTVGKYGGHLALLLGENGQPKFGNVFRYAVADWSTTWFNHPDPDVDLSLLYFNPIEKRINTKFGAELFYYAIPESLVATESQIESLDAIETVIFVGYSDGTCDTKTWIPVMRSCTTATPIGVDFECKPNFLIDAPIFPGSCGSPIFVYNSGPYFCSSGEMMPGPRLLFVGSLNTGFMRHQPDPVVTQDQVIWEQERTHLGLAVQARMVNDTIDAFIQARGLE